MVRRRPFIPTGSVRPGTDERPGDRMAQVVEVPELESWFLVHWRDSEHPAVLMEFETREEAEDALCAAFAEMTIRLDEDTARLPITVFPALTMLEDPALSRALASWDAQLAELDAIAQRTMDL